MILMYIGLLLGISAFTNSTDKIELMRAVRCEFNEEFLNYFRYGKLNFILIDNFYKSRNLANIFIDIKESESTVYIKPSTFLKRCKFKTFQHDKTMPTVIEEICDYIKKKVKTDKLNVYFLLDTTKTEDADLWANKLNKYFFSNVRQIPNTLKHYVGSKYFRKHLTFLTFEIDRFTLVASFSEDFFEEICLKLIGDRGQSKYEITCKTFSSYEVLRSWIKKICKSMLNVLKIQLQNQNLSELISKFRNFEDENIQLFQMLYEVVYLRLRSTRKHNPIYSNTFLKEFNQYLYYRKVKKY